MEWFLRQEQPQRPGLSSPGKDISKDGCAKRSTKQDGKVGRESLLVVPRELGFPPGPGDTRGWPGQNWQKEMVLCRDGVKYSRRIKTSWVNSQASTAGF